MRTSSPGPPGRADAAQWRRWVFPAAIAADLVTLLALPRGAAPGPALTYTQFVADVGAGTVRAVTIGPAGQVTGSLASGDPFTTTIPVALGGNGLAGNLAAHHVQVTATTAAATSSPLLSVLIGLLPLLLIGGLLYLGIRKVPLSSGGGLGGLAKAKARVIDAERPATRFTDVAGYAAVKTEISEVVDYLRDPGEVLVPLPGRAERAAILAAHARGTTLGPDADLDQVAAATPGFSGADLANLVNEAAVTAVRDGRTTLTAADFAAARDRVLLGTRRASPLAPAELATVAVHEAGHALVATLSPHADPVSRVTVLGAGQALGLTETLPADDRRLYGERYLADTLAVRLGGRAAERLICGEASTGAADDLASATALATQMIREFGLSQAIGPVSYGGPPAGHPALAQRGYSEHTQWLVDQEVTALLTSAETRARDLLTRHREALDQLTAALLEQETVTGDQVRVLAEATSPAALPAGTPASVPAGTGASLPAGIPASGQRL
jgi:ATP-dependent Zn protease